MVTSYIMSIQSLQCISSFVNKKDIPCIRVMIMKKTENVSFRTDEETKEILSQYAAERKWSISLLVEDIVQQWIKEKGLKAENEE